VTVTIEFNESPGVQFFLVGLPDSAVKESQHRIASALQALNHHWPGKQIVINMAPADIRKEGLAIDNIRHSYNSFPVKSKNKIIAG
jgi:magnesium chelatase family protein